MAFAGSRFHADINPLFESGLYIVRQRPVLPLGAVPNLLKQVRIDPDGNCGFQIGDPGERGVSQKMRSAIRSNGNLVPNAAFGAGFFNAAVVG